MRITLAVAVQVMARSFYLQSSEFDVQRSELKTFNAQRSTFNAQVIGKELAHVPRTLGARLPPVFTLIRLTRGLRLATCDSRDTDSDTDSDALQV